MNIKLLEKLYQRYAFEDLQGIKSDWDSITADYEEETGKKLVFETARKKITPAVRKRLWENKLDSGANVLPSDDIEILGDGSRKLLAYREMTEAESKDPDKVMEINGYNPEKWDLVKLKISEWTMGKKNKNYSIGLEVKPKDMSKFDVKDLVKVNKDYKYVHEVIKHSTKKTQRAIEIGVTDTHIGSIHFNESAYKDKIREIKAFINKEDVEKVFLIFYGDIIHVDNISNTTARGTQLEVEDTAYSMFKKAKDLMNFTVAEFADRKLDVLWVQGNHSRLVEYALFDGLNDVWSANKHISFDTDERRRKAFLYGTQLVGIHHGDLPKKQEFDWLARDFRELWGQAEHVEQHSGHIHHETVQVKGAITARTLTSMKETDHYEYTMGYDNVNRSIQTFIYDKKNGLKQINYF